MSTLYPPYLFWDMVLSAHTRVGTKPLDLPRISFFATIGRKYQVPNLTAEDQRLGGHFVGLPLVKFYMRIRTTGHTLPSVDKAMSGATLALLSTLDLMIFFQDATFPMILMSILAFFDSSYRSCSLTARKGPRSKRHPIIYLVIYDCVIRCYFPVNLDSLLNPVHHAFDRCHSHYRPRFGNPGRQQSCARSSSTCGNLPSGVFWSSWYCDL
ncbi:hypothetical protein F1880_003954 [Penicillium rolfsii]|nr:hypothetical protein F1880_003954 [Penicillium rolfsii]